MPMPKGYWIAHVTVRDTAAYEPYRNAVAALLPKYQATYLVRGGAQTVVEGAIRPRSVVIEFPTLQAALDCYHGPEYQAAKALRIAAADGDVSIIAGWEG